jgi:hypothetical protein
MPEPDSDPIASTQMFRAFVQGAETEPVSRRPRLLTVALAVALVAVVAVVVVWLLVR